MIYLKAFLIGGALCAIGQLLILKTKITPARILVLFVVSGVILGAIGVYKPLVEFAGAGATVPLTGFGYALSQGAIDMAKERGALGAFLGGITKAAGGITAALVFGTLNAVIFKPKAKK